MVNIFFEETEILDLDPEFFVSWLSDVCSKENTELGEISLIFCSDDYLLEVNKEHLDHDYYTDIITFDYRMGDVINGDLFISVDRVRDNAKQLSEMFHVELYRVVVHGTLHIIGYGDKSEDEAKLMREKEQEMLNMIVSRET